jgi:hypothetical protein
MATAALSALAEWAWPSPKAKAPHKTKMAATYEARRNEAHTHRVRALVGRCCAPLRCAARAHVCSQHAAPPR